MTNEKIYIGFDGQQSGIGIVDCTTGRTETMELTRGFSICALDFCPVDNLLACGASDGYCRLYSISDNETSELPYLYVGRPVVGVAAYPDFKTAVLDKSGRVISWRQDTNIRFKILPQEQLLGMLVKLPGSLLAGIGNSTVHFWDISTEELIEQLTLPQEVIPTDSVFWPQYGLLVIASRSGIYSVDVNDGHRRQMQGYPGGDWRLFTNSGSLYSLETKSGILYRSSDPEQDIQQMMLCRGITDAAMAADKIIVIEESGDALEYNVSEHDIRYSGKLPWQNCYIVNTAAEFERISYQQRSKYLLTEQIQREFDCAIGQSNNQHALELIEQLTELGEERQAELLRLRLAAGCGDIAQELSLLCDRIENNSPGELDSSLVLRYLELLIRSCQFEQALDVCCQFKIKNYKWLEDIDDILASGEYVVEPASGLSQLLEIHQQLDIPLNGTFVLSRCSSEVIAEARITHTELADKLAEISAEESIGQITGETLKLCWITDSDVSMADVLTFSALEASDNYVLIPLLRFVEHESATIVEPVILFSCCYKNGDIVSHNQSCLQALKLLSQSNGENLWPGYLHGVICQALTRLKFLKQKNIRKLGGVHE